MVTAKELTATAHTQAAGDGGVSVEGGRTTEELRTFRGSAYDYYV